MKDNKIWDEIVLTRTVWGNKFGQKFADILETLFKEGEVCKVYDDDDGVYIIEHGHDNRFDYWGSPELMWLSEDEVEEIESIRYYKDKKGVDKIYDTDLYIKFLKKTLSNVLDYIKSLKAGEISADEFADGVVSFMEDLNGSELDDNAVEDDTNENNK